MLFMYINIKNGKNKRCLWKGVLTILDNKVSGNLIIIGGAEDKKGNKIILKQVANSLDKENDELVIVAVASKIPKELGREYKDIFTSLGVKNISILDVNKREDAFWDRKSVV